MRSALKAALFYVTSVFALGFVLGVARVVLIAPAIGELPAVCVEIPVLLIASWFICRHAIRRFSVASDSARRLVVGAAAFALLIGAEFCLAIFALGRAPEKYFADLQTTSGILGLAAQILFGLFPLLQPDRREVQ